MKRPSKRIWSDGGAVSVWHHVQALDAYIDHVEAENVITQAALAGHLRLPLDTPLEELLTKLRGHPRN